MLSERIVVAETSQVYVEGSDPPANFQYIRTRHVLTVTATSSMNSVHPDGMDVVSWLLETKVAIMMSPDATPVGLLQVTVLSFVGEGVLPWVAVPR
jgi:hypothetical protein